MFLRLGWAVVGHPWRVIGLWVIVAVAIIGLAPKLATTTNEASFLPAHYQSVQAQDLQQKAFPNAAAPAAIAVFERSDGHPLTAADSAKVAAIATGLASEHIPTLTTVQAGPPSPNRLVQTISVQMPNSQGQLTKAQTNAVEIVARRRLVHGGGHRHAGGGYRERRSVRRPAAVGQQGDRGRGHRHHRPHHRVAARDLPQPGHHLAPGARYRGRTPRSPPGSSPQRAKPSASTSTAP